MIPEGWEQVTGAEVTSKITKGASPKWQGFDYQDDGVLFVTSENVRDGYLDLSKEKYLSNEFGIKMANSKLINGDILINIVGASIGRSCQFLFDELEARTNQAVAIFRPNEMAESGYLSYYFQAPETVDRLLKAQSSTARSNLSLGDLRGFQIDLPPLPEQRKIAEILSTWDRAIEVTEALLATARTQKRALMQSLLTGKRRFPEFTGQEWREVRFDDVFNRVRRKNSTGNQNTLTISGQGGLVSQTEYFNKRVAAADLSGYTLLVGGDFAYNKSYSSGYPMGAIKILPAGQTGVVSSLYLCFALADSKKNCRDFFRHFFEAGCFNQEIYKIAQEGARNHGLLNVSVHDFFKLRLCIPRLEEQQKIADFLNLAEREADYHQGALRKIRIEKKALMQQLLTGKRRVAV
jgi:type I restriction enzyme S subunit